MSFYRTCAATFATIQGNHVSLCFAVLNPRAEIQSIHAESKLLPYDCEENKPNRFNDLEQITSDLHGAARTPEHSLPSLSVRTRSLWADFLFANVSLLRLEQRFLQRLNMFIDVKSEFLLVICNKVSRNQKLVMFPEEKWAHGNTGVYL